MAVPVEGKVSESVFTINAVPVPLINPPDARDTLLALSIVLAAACALTAAVLLVRVSDFRSASVPRFNVPLSRMDTCPEVAPFKAPLRVAVPEVPETVSVPPSAVVPATVRLPVPLTVTLPCRFDVAFASVSASDPPVLMLRWLLELELRLPMLEVLVRPTVTPDARFR